MLEALLMMSVLAGATLWTWRCTRAAWRLQDALEAVRARLAGTLPRTAIMAHRFERDGEQWVLRSLHTGSAMPIEVGDIVCLATPAAVPKGIDGDSFRKQHWEEVSRDE